MSPAVSSSLLAACPPVDDLVTFATGRVSGTQLDALEQHLDECPACQQVLIGLVRDATDASQGEAGTAAHAPILLPRGTRLGRYTVLDAVGMGGMGVIYAAYDPELDRKVALKVLRREVLEGQPDEAARLLRREAQVMARLSHPNIVGVHDVGAWSERVFIAMEYVEGATLREELARTPRSPDEVLDLFLAAGAGLSAAHQAGLVHRDVKPDNLLVGKDGRVRVTDFGLARQAADGHGPRQLAGTLRYMSPEQLRGEQIDARSDQFSFCVSVFEALEGRLPFLGRSPEELLAEIRAGAFTGEAQLARSRPRLFQVLRRGLSFERDARFAHLAALLAALEKARRPRLSRAARGAGVALAVTALAAAGGAAWWRNAQLCGGGEAAMAQTWNAARREQISRAFQAIPLPEAAQALPRLLAALDQQATAWRTMHREACEATRRRGEQTEEVLALRMACLERRRDELDLRARLLGEADAATVKSVPRILGALPSLSACANTSALLETRRLPEDAAARGHAERAYQLLAQGRASFDVGRYPQARKLVEEGLAEARQSAYPVALAEALVTIGFLQNNPKEAEQAERNLLEAVRQAERGGARAWRSRAWIQLMQLDLSRPGRDAAAEQSAEHARAVMEGGGPSEQEALLELNLGLLKIHQEQLDAAIEHLHRAEALAKARPQAAPSSHRTFLAQVHNDLGIAYRRQGRFAEAIAAQEQVLADRREVLGEQHSLVAGSLQNLAILYLEQERWDDALAAARKAEEIVLVAEGPKGDHLSDLAQITGAAHAGSNRFVEAKAALNRAIELELQRSGPDADLSEPISALGDLSLATGRFDEALGYADRLSGFAERFHVRGGMIELAALLLRGVALRGTGRAHEAVAILTRAKEVAAKQSGQRTLASALTELGRAQLDAKEPHAAIATLEEAVKLALARAETTSSTRAAAQLGLALALEAAGQSPERARALGQSAKEALAQKGPGSPQLRADLEGFLGRVKP